MIRMLDSNICIYIMRETPSHVAQKLRAYRPGDIAISSIVFSELSYGIHKSVQFKKNLAALEKFTMPIDVLSYDSKAAFLYGELRAELEKKGTPIGQLDTMIAAHAISENVVLVTNNLKEFSRIKSLKCENWA